MVPWRNAGLGDSRTHDRQAVAFGGGAIAGLSGSPAIVDARPWRSGAGQAQAANPKTREGAESVEQTDRPVGRFAPSPTGPLHFGSLIAALGSFLSARSHQGRWLVRMEDLDRPRTVDGAADQILRTLERFALTWDGEVLYQSHRGDAYRSAAEALQGANLLYRCRCTRREIAAGAGRGVLGFIYPGTCRSSGRELHSPGALRVLTRGAAVSFLDRFQGPQSMDLERESGDFVVRRADGLHAYQLAVVVDDAAQGVTEVVRGADILPSTPRQIFLQRSLGLAAPSYGHLPLAVNHSGEKLSKMSRAPAIEAERAGLHLARALSFLGQAPPPDLAHESAEQVIEWGLRYWRADHVPRLFQQLEASRNGVSRLDPPCCAP